MSGGPGGQIDPTQIDPKQIDQLLNSSKGMGAQDISRPNVDPVGGSSFMPAGSQDPLQHILNKSQADPNVTPQVTPSTGMAGPVSAPPNPLAKAAQNGIGSAATAGLGAGDAASAAARASGAMLPGAGSADVVGGMMSGLSDKMRDDIQKKMQMIMQAAGG